MSVETAVFVVDEGNMAELKGEATSSLIYVNEKSITHFKTIHNKYLSLVKLYHVIR